MFVTISYMYSKQNFSTNPLGAVVSILLGLFMVGISCNSLRSFLVSFSFSETELIINEWGFFSIRKIILKKDDIEKIDISYGVIPKSRLIIYPFNKKRIIIDLYYVNQVEGNLEQVILSQYSPNEPKTKFSLSVAKTISTKMKIPFRTIYLDDA